MFGSTGEGDWDVLLQRLSAVLDDLQTAGLSTLSGQEELDVLRQLERQKNRLPAVEHRVIADVEARGTAHERACRSTAVLLTQLLRITPREAGERVTAAANLGPRRGLTGEKLPALFEPVAAAQALGEISPAQARVITETVTKLPGAIAADHEHWVQDALLEQAHTANPFQLAQAARDLAYLLDQDGKLVEEHDRTRRRDLRIKRRPDGSAPSSRWPPPPQPKTE